MIQTLLAVASAHKWRLLMAVLFFYAGVQTCFAQADLAIQGASVSPTSVAVGNSITATGTIYNLGSATATSSNIGYYLSTDNLLDSNDTFIGSSTGSSLSASGYSGSSSYRSTSVTIPGNTAVGSYYILYVADYLNVVAESNENNNVSSVSITVVPQSVDFSLSSAYLYNTSVSAGGTITTEASISNVGNTPSSSSNIGYYLSTNATLDASDVFIGSSTGGAISPGSYYYFSKSVTIPGNTTPGTYYIIFAADYLNSVAEGNENNNTTARSFTVVEPFVDLTLQSPYVYSSSVMPGNYVSTEVRVHNLGNTTAASSNVGYYLSTNNTFDAADTFIGSSSGGSLSGPNYTYRSQSVLIPGNTAPGSYYLIFVADYLNTVTESNENNNTVSAAITVASPTIDLTLSSPYLSQSTVSAGNPVNVSVTVNNQGNTTATSSNVGYYLSANSTLDASDALIGFQNGSSISGGSYNYNYTSVTIPASTAPGTYYLIMVADYLNSVAESNEQNNQISVTFSVTEYGTTFIMPSSGNTSFTTCTGTLYDNGGTGYYANSTNGTVTINPATSGNKVRLTFTSFSTESCCDYLYIYDGTSTSAPLIGQYYGSYSPGTVYATNSSGALTLRFSTDGSVAGSGFEATIACVTSVPMADLVMQSPTVSSSSITAGNVVSVNSQIHNQGGVSASSSHVGYYLSANNTYESSDIYLGNSAGYSLASGTSSTRSATVTIPQSVAAGNYNILFIADYTGLVNEEDETNNLNSVPVTILAPSVDLTMLSAFTSSSTLTPGTSFTASSFIANQGTSTANSSNVGYYLSANNTFESTDVYLGTTNGGILTSGNSASRSSSLVLPSSTTAGNYNLFFVADPTNAVGETNEDNNNRIVAVTVSSSNFIDIIMSSKTLASSNVVAGGTVAASGIIQNIGNVSSPRVAVGFYLSTNNTLDQSDILLTSSQTAGALAAGATEEVPATLTIPANTTPGSYYILYKSDYENHIAESSEENGLTSVAITISAASVDLIVQNATVNPTSVTAGQSVSVTASIRNQGSVAATSSTIGYYLSTNNTLDASDTLLSFSIGNALAAGATASKTATVTIPATTSSGSYYILFVADHANAVTESTETNNVSAVALTVGTSTIDLAIQTPTVSAPSVVAGTAVTLTASVLNNGTVASNATSIKYYLSQNTTIDAQDVVLGTTGLLSVAAGGSAPQQASMAIPANTVAGNYYVLFFVDSDLTNAESNESNNTASVALTVTAVGANVDLWVENPSVTPTTVASGNTVSASSTIKNNGLAVASASTVGYYLSTDNSYNSGDIALGYSAGGSLAGGAIASKTATLTIPAATAAGSYYILFVADHGNAVSELNETNNVLSVAITVTAPPRADLLISAATATPTTTVAGDTVATSVTVRNSGQAAATSNRVGYYLSSSATLDNSATYLGSSYIPGLSGAGAITFTPRLIIPAGTAPGAYYILVKADDENEVIESNEGNNVYSLAITITASTVDLRVQARPFVSSVMAGNSYSLGIDITNNGNATASQSTVGLYLSTDNTLSGGDILLSGIPGGQLNAGSTDLRSSSITIPGTTSAGNYYLLVVADYNNAIVETNESNNVQAIAISVVTLPLPDWQVRSVSLLPSSTTTPGGTIAVSSTIYNVGTADAPPTKYRIYLSSDTLYQSTDLMLREINGMSTSLAPGGMVSSLNSGLVIPSTTPTGSYYILVVYDFDNSLNEHDKANNINFAQLTVSVTTSLAEGAADNKLTVWPNPAADKINIEANNLDKGERKAEISIYTAVGEKVYYKPVSVMNGKLTESLNVEQLKSGVYFVRVVAGDTATVKRIVIQK